MHQLTLVKVSLIVLLIPCAGIGLLRVGRRLANRRAYARFAAADFDPYWAHSSWWAPACTGRTRKRFLAGCRGGNGVGSRRPA
ncbi:hypothetical protein [Streptomyces sp. NPDC017949]|uniref:hypothetical protein n=1 Tax=Streptomyces sp. NPDC017949 TaxID=3365020 RepID=UPI003789A134